MRTACYLFLATLLIRPAFAADESPAETVVVTGQVVDEAGHAVKGALVRFPSSSLARFPIDESKAKLEATTDADGRFKLIPPPEFPGYLSTCIATVDDGARQGFFQLPRTDSRFPTSVSIVLRPPREIQVSVVDGSGEPVPEAHVQAFTRSQSLAQSLTNASGRAVLKIPAGLPLDAVTAVKPGTGLDYFLFQRPRTRLEPEQVKQTFDATFEFRLTGARKVIVAVSDTHGNPIEGARLYLADVELPGKGGSLRVFGLVGEHRLTAADGTAAYDFLPTDDKATIGFYATKPNTHQRQYSVSDALPLNGRVELALPALIAARGRVLDAAGRPVPAAIVEARGGSFVSSFRTTETSDAQGNFELMLAPNHFYQMVARKQHDVSPGVPFILKEEPIDGLAAHLKPGTRVYGTVTIGSDNTPVKAQTVGLILTPSRDYSDFPEEQRLPAPAGSRRTLRPVFIQWTPTDKQGRFEFFAGPGKYSLQGPTGVYGRDFSPRFKHPSFTIDKQKELEVNLHAEPREVEQIIGRVFHKGQPDKPLARAKVFINSKNHTRFRDRPSAITDKSGVFQTPRLREAADVYVLAEDNAFAAIAQVEPNQKRVELQAVPTGRAAGRLVVRNSGRALPNAVVSYYVEVADEKPDGTTFRFSFEDNTRTEPDGSFELTGFVPGFQYLVGVTAYRPPEFQDRFRLSMIAGVLVDLERANSIDVGELTLVPSEQRPNPKEKVPRWFAPESEPTSRINAKLRDTRLGKQNLVLVIATPDHPFSRGLYLGKHDYADEDRIKFCQATADFEFLPIQPERLKQADGLPGGVAEFAASLTADDSFTLAVFSPSGELLAKVSQPELTTNGQLDLDKTSTFLHNHAPELPDAQQLIEAAFTQAKRENKKVLLQHSETLCSPCTLLSRYFDKHRNLIEKDYIWVTIDPRFNHGREIINHYRPQPGGVPWFAVIAPDGKTLATSDSKQGNIGYPSTDTARKHFESILRQTAPHLTDKDIATLLNDLKD